MTGLFCGLDIGSTGIKILLIDEQGDEILVHQVSTPWRHGRDGATSMRQPDLVSALRTLFHETSEQLRAITTHTNRSLAAIAVSGMGETGFVVNQRGHAVCEGYAWFDPRGSRQVRDLPASLRNEFAGRTGLPWGVQAPVAKLLYERDQGTDLPGHQWVNLPEYVAETLGARRISEQSLVSRTGLIDQSTGQPWPEMLEYLGIEEAFIPELTNAGQPLGFATADWLPSLFKGAAITVAGHDHLVSAFSNRKIPDEHYHVSLGTAEVLLRSVDGPLGFDARERLGNALINCVRHVVPDKYVLVAGVKTGLLMRRCLQMLGISDRTGRQSLDDQVMMIEESALAEGAIDVRGARNDDGILKLTIRSDGVSPAEVFRAVLEHGNHEIQRLIDAMDRELPPATSALLTGGWADMRSVVALRSRVLPNLTVSTRRQDTAYGAALFARNLIGGPESLQFPDTHARARSSL